MLCQGAVTPHGTGGKLLNYLSRIKESRPVREKGVSFRFKVDVGQDEFRAPRKCFGVKRCAPGEEKFFIGLHGGRFLPVTGGDDARCGKSATA